MSFASLLAGSPVSVHDNASCTHHFKSQIYPPSSQSVHSSKGSSFMISPARFGSIASPFFKASPPGNLKLFISLSLHPFFQEHFRGEPFTPSRFSAAKRCVGLSWACCVLPTQLTKSGSLFRQPAPVLSLLTELCPLSEREMAIFSRPCHL